MKIKKCFEATTQLIFSLCFFRWFILLQVLGLPHTSWIVEFNEGKASIEIWKFIKNQTENASLPVWKKNLRFILGTQKFWETPSCIEMTTFFEVYDCCFKSTRNNNFNFGSAATSNRIANPQVTHRWHCLAPRTISICPSTRKPSTMCLLDLSSDQNP